MNLELLMKLARLHSGCAGAKVVASIEKNGRTISVGYNRRKTHPLAKKFGKNSEAIFLHAEVDAIVKAIQIYGADGLRGSTLRVARVLKDGSAALARPCEGCQRAIVAFEIGEVEWTKKTTAKTAATGGQNA